MSWHLTVTDLKQWAYCPRVVFYSHCMPRLRPMTFKMEAGLDAHEDEKARERRRTGQLYGLTNAERIENVSIQSDALGLSSSIDLVLRQGDRVWPVEYKLSRRTAIATHFKLQLTAYGLLLEEAWGVTADAGFFYSLMTRRAERVTLSRQLRRKVLSTTAEIRNMLADERVPPATEKLARCVNCEFRRFCNDLF